MNFVDLSSLSLLDNDKRGKCGIHSLLQAYNAPKRLSMQQLDVLTAHVMECMVDLSQRDASHFSQHTMDTVLKAWKAELIEKVKNGGCIPPPDFFNHELLEAAVQKCLVVGPGCLVSEVKAIDLFVFKVVDEPISGDPPAAVLIKTCGRSRDIEDNIKRIAILESSNTPHCRAIVGFIDANGDLDEVSALNKMLKDLALNDMKGQAVPFYGSEDGRSYRPFCEQAYLSGKIARLVMYAQCTDPYGFETIAYLTGMNLSVVLEDIMVASTDVFCESEVLKTLGNKVATLTADYEGLDRLSEGIANRDVLQSDLSLNLETLDAIGDMYKTTLLVFEYCRDGGGFILTHCRPNSNERCQAILFRHPSCWAPLGSASEGGEFEFYDRLKELCRTATYSSAYGEISAADPFLNFDQNEIAESVTEVIGNNCTEVEGNNDKGRLNLGVVQIDEAATSGGPFVKEESAQQLRRKSLRIVEAPQKTVVSKKNKRNAARVIDPAVEEVDDKAGLSETQYGGIFASWNLNCIDGQLQYDSNVISIPNKPETLLWYTFIRMAREPNSRGGGYTMKLYAGDVVTYNKSVSLTFVLAYAIRPGPARQAALKVVMRDGQGKFWIVKPYDISSKQTQTPRNSNIATLINGLLESLAVSRFAKKILNFDGKASVAKERKSVTTTKAMVRNDDGERVTTRASTAIHISAMLPEESIRAVKRVQRIKNDSDESFRAGNRKQMQHVQQPPIQNRHHQPVAPYNKNKSEDPVADLCSKHDTPVVRSRFGGQKPPFSTIPEQPNFEARGVSSASKVNQANRMVSDSTEGTHETQFYQPQPPVEPLPPWAQPNYQPQPPVQPLPTWAQPNYAAEVAHGTQLYQPQPPVQPLPTWAQPNYAAEVAHGTQLYQPQPPVQPLPTWAQPNYAAEVAHGTQLYQPQPSVQPLPTWAQPNYQPHAQLPTWGPPSYYTEVAHSPAWSHFKNSPGDFPPGYAERWTHSSSSRVYELNELARQANSNFLNSLVDQYESRVSTMRRQQHDTFMTQLYKSYR